MAQLSFEEALYLCHDLKRLVVAPVPDGSALYTKLCALKPILPYTYAVYRTMRNRNW